MATVAAVVVTAAIAAGALVAGCDEPAPPRLSLRQAYGLQAPTQLAAGRTALVLVDFQRELVDGGLPLPGADEAVRHARTLLRWARDRRMTIVHVRQLAARPDAPLFRAGSRGVQPVAELIARGSELEISKSMSCGASRTLRAMTAESAVCSGLGGAFSRTDLDARLRAHGVDTVVIAGLMTHLAVDSTARDAAALGYRVIVAGDATATRGLPSPAGGRLDASAVQTAALAAIGDRFADVMTTEQVVALPVEPAAIAQR